MATKETPKEETLPAVKADVSGMLPVKIDYTSDCGAGFEDADSSAYAIPFLRMLQSGSPQAKKKDPAYIQGAEEGDLINTVTEKIYKGDEGVTIIPCHFLEKFNKWVPNRGGFRGSLSPADYAETQKQRIKITNQQGEQIEVEADMEGNVLTDTREHYCLLVEPDGSYVEVLIALSSTQLKRSKQWMTVMRGLRKNGRTVPMFSQVYRLSSIGEQNDKGSWCSHKFEHIGEVQYAELYEAAKMFHESVRGGRVKVAEQDEDLPY